MNSQGVMFSRIWYFWNFWNMLVFLVFFELFLSPDCGNKCALLTRGGAALSAPETRILLTEAELDAAAD